MVRNAALASILLILGAFHLATLRQGFDWFQDSVGYVVHAENLAAGRDYGESGYIPNPYRFIAPKTYPPGYPVLLAPLVKAFGTDTDILRIQNVAILLGMVVAAWGLFRKELPLPHLCVVVAAVGLHPLFWERVQKLLSDIPFVMAILLSLWAYEAAQAKRDDRRRRLVLAVLTGFLVYYATITRTLGLALVPGIVLHELLRFRRLTLAAVVMTGTVLLLHGAVNVSPFGRALERAESVTGVPPNPFGNRPPEETGNDEFTYRHSNRALVFHNVLRQLDSIPRRVVRNTTVYTQWIAQFWDNGSARSVQGALFVLGSIVAAVGFVARLRRRSRVVDVFAVVYFLTLLPWSFAEHRYLLPLLPVYYLCLLAGIDLLAKSTGARRALLAVTVLAIGGTIGARYAVQDFGPLDDSYTSSDAEALYAFTRAETDPDAVLLAEFPRQIAYFTDRRASAPHRVLSEKIWWPHAQWLGARHVVVGPLGVRPPIPSVDTLAAFVEGAPDRFEKVFEQGRFRVYRMHAPGG